MNDCRLVKLQLTLTVIPNKMDSIPSPLFRNKNGQLEISGSEESWRALAHQMFSQETLSEILDDAEKKRREEEYEECLSRPRQPSVEEEMLQIIKEMRKWQGRSLALSGILLSGALIVNEEEILNICMFIISVIMFGNIILILVIHFIKRFGGFPDSFA